MATTWHGESALGGGALQIAVGRNEDGRLHIFYIGTNGDLYHNWQTALNSTPGWGDCIFRR
jgi:hypothetical protein